MDRIRLWRWDDLSELGKRAWKYFLAKKYLDGKSIEVPRDLIDRWVRAARRWKEEVDRVDPRDLYEDPDARVTRMRKREPQEYVRAVDFPPETVLEEEEAAASIASWDSLDDLKRDFLVYRMAVNYRAQESRTNSAARDLVVRTVDAAEKLEGRDEPAVHSPGLSKSD